MDEDLNAPNRWSIKMKNNKTRFNLLISSGFGLIWFLALVCIFSIPKNERENVYPNVRVSLQEPVFGVSGIDSNRLTWVRIDNEHVVKYENHVVTLESRYRAYVSLDKTELSDTLSDNLSKVSRKELVRIFSDVCCGTIPSEELGIDPDDFPKTSINVAGEEPSSFLLPNEFSIDVQGRYSGHVGFYSYLPEIEEEKTNINQVLNNTNHISVKTILLSLFYAVFVSVVVFLIVQNAKRLKARVLFCLCISVFFFTLLALLLFCA